MTAPWVLLTTAKTSDGCTSCGTQDTVQLHPHRGRECPAHVTLPPGGFRPDLAADMVDLGYPRAALAYLRAWLVAEAERRFAALAASFGGRP